jgi:multicomponent Na+:H+ antiporter subunit D
MLDGDWSSDVCSSDLLEKSPLIMFMVVPLTITAIFSVIFGFYPDFFIKVVASADTGFFGNIIKGIAGL